MGGVIGLLQQPAEAWIIDRELGDGHANFGTTVQPADQRLGAPGGGGMMQCDVMRDYYYDSETGEWYGWAGDTYLANCVRVGDSAGGDGSCEGQDANCECEKNPELCGGGGDPPPEPEPEQCVCEDANGKHVLNKDTKECTDKPGCRDKKTCHGCNKTRNNQLNALSTQSGNCTTNYRRIAEQKCRRNQWRAGDPRPPAERMGADPAWEAPGGSPLRPSYCEVDMGSELEGPPRPGRGPVRRTVCAPSSDFSSCVQTWMSTYDPATVSRDSDYPSIWGTVIKSVEGTLGPASVNVDFGGTSTTTTLGLNEGYQSACDKAMQPKEKAIVDEFDKCASQASQDEGRQCKAW